MFNNSPRPSKDGAFSSTAYTSRGRVVRRLTAALAHSVNNALTGVVGNLELALRTAEPGSVVRGHLSASLACAYRAAESVRQVVLFVMQPPQSPDRPFALRDVVEGAARQAEMTASAGITIKVCAEKEGRILGRPQLLAAAVEQISRNALEAMPAGGQLTLEVDEADGRCLLRVRDTGPGIDPEVLCRLCEPFVTTKAFGHLGLGLALAADVVEAADGNLTVTSAPSLGTTVTFAFPAYCPDRTAMGPVPTLSAVQAATAQ